MSLRFWLQLSLTNGIGPILARRLVEATGDVATACTAPASLLQTIDGIGSSKAPKIAAAFRKAAAEVDRELARAEGAKARIICPDDDEYPTLLKTIPDPPLVLYVRGSMQPRDLNAVAIVGSRKCSFYGREQAERFGALLAGAAITVLSGGARGIDSAAHRGALMQPGGRTIAVLGSGVNVVYPPENAALFDQIAESGAVLSEFPMNAPPAAENFPKRNRIVSGMSRGVLVIEAADVRSGALITARQAGEEGRTVFALPGRVDNALSIGPHKLIRDGAILAAGLDDILDGLGPLPQIAIDVPEPKLFEGAPPAEVPGLSANAQQLIDVLSNDPMSVDRIADSTGLDVSMVLRELTLMTLRGHVRRIDGQNYVRSR